MKTFVLLLGVVVLSSGCSSVKVKRATDADLRAAEASNLAAERSAGRVTELERRGLSGSDAKSVAGSEARLGRE